MITAVKLTKKGELIRAMGRNPFKYKNGYVTPARIISKEERVVFDAIYKYNKTREFDISVFTLIEQLNYRNNQSKDVIILKNILNNCLSGKRM